MSEEDLIFTYQGIVNDEVVSDMLQLAESAIHAESIKTVVKRRIFRVLLEGIQNSYKHQSEKVFGDAKMQEVTAVLGRKDGYYELVLGNYILKDEADVLQSKIEEINGMDHQKLRESYLETLNNDNRTKEGGSGLGLMDIARKTEEPLDCTFSKVSDEISYFTLHVKINKNG